MAASAFEKCQMNSNDVGNAAATDVDDGQHVDGQHVE